MAETRILTISIDSKMNFFKNIGAPKVPLIDLYFRYLVPNLIKIKKNEKSKLIYYVIYCKYVMNISCPTYKALNEAGFVVKDYYEK